MTELLFTREDVQRGVDTLVASRYHGELDLDTDDLTVIVQLVLHATGQTKPRGLRYAYRAARLWLAYQTRPSCSGDTGCRAHPGTAGRHMGYTYDSWRDYTTPSRRRP